MNLWSRIKKLSLSKLMGLGWILVRTPKLIVPVYQMTQRTMSICDEHYGKAHFNSGKANAFRHALWNYLLCAEINNIIGDPQRSTSFTEQLVNHYEKVTQNEEMDRNMDLHNNLFGRNLFLNKFGENEENPIVFLHKSAKMAKKITKTDDLEQFSNQLVYLKDDV